MDTCDRCHANGQVQVRSVNQLELVFCAHHFRDLEVLLSVNGWTIVTDNRPQLLTTT